MLMKFRHTRGQRGSSLIVVIGLLAFNIVLFSMVVSKMDVLMALSRSAYEHNRVSYFLLNISNELSHPSACLNTITSIGNPEMIDAEKKRVTTIFSLTGEITAINKTASPSEDPLQDIHIQNSGKDWTKNFFPIDEMYLEPMERNTADPDKYANEVFPMTPGEEGFLKRKFVIKYFLHGVREYTFEPIRLRIKRIYDDNNGKSVAIILSCLLASNEKNVFLTGCPQDKKGISYYEERGKVKCRP